MFVPIFVVKPKPILIIWLVMVWVLAIKANGLIVLRLSSSTSSLRIFSDLVVLFLRRWTILYSLPFRWVWKWFQLPPSNEICIVVYKKKSMRLCYFGLTWPYIRVWDIRCENYHNKAIVSKFLYRLGWKLTLHPNYFLPCMMWYPIWRMTNVKIHTPKT